MSRIDAYIESIYKDFDKRDKEANELKEEMKSHLYEEVEELKRQGYSEEESIRVALENFGEEGKVANELEDIMIKQNKFIKLLWKIAVGVLLAGVLCYVAAIYFETMAVNDWEKNKAITYSVVIDEQIKPLLSGKESITESDRGNITKILDDFNSKNHNGLYYIALEKDNNKVYEYKKDITEGMDVNRGRGSSSGDDIKGWTIHHKTTDYAQMLDSVMWDMRFSISQADNLLHNRLKKVSYQLCFAYWMLMILYFIQKDMMKNISSRAKITTLMVETLLVFTALTFDDHKDFIFFIAIGFTAVNIIYERFFRRSRLKA